MATWSSLYPHVLPDVPGAPEIVVDFAIRQSVLRFCRESGLWVVTTTPITVVASQASYNYPALTDGQVLKLLEATFTGAAGSVPLGTEPNSLYYSALGYYNTATDTPIAVISADDNTTFSLWPTPSSAVSGTVTLRYAAVPSQTAATFPDFIYNTFADAVAAGAKARLMMTPDRPYSNANLGAAYERDFSSAVLRAKITRQNGYQAKAPQVANVWFGA